MPKLLKKRMIKNPYRNLPRRKSPGWLKKKIETSRVNGWLFVLIRTRGDFFKNIESARLRRKATSRGFCVWCIEIIYPKHSAYQVCKECPVFEPDKFLHGNCVVREKCCDKCRRLPYLMSERRVQ